jgi:hypothetical protein
MPLAELRDWPEAPTQKNLVEAVERLQAVRNLGVAPDHEQRIHRARYAAMVREMTVLSAQHLSRFDAARRLARRSSSTNSATYRSAPPAEPCSSIS